MIKIRNANCHLLILFYLTTLCLIGCQWDEADEEAAEAVPPRYFQLTILNQSQFELRHVFIHQPDTNYKASASLIDEYLITGESVSKKVLEGSFRVTVTRLKNQDGPLLAYTTAFPIDVTSDCLLEYFDDQYRFQAIQP